MAAKIGWVLARVSTVEFLGDEASEYAWGGGKASGPGAENASQVGAGAGHFPYWGELSQAVALRCCPSGAAKMGSAEAPGVTGSLKVGLGSYNLSADRQVVRVTKAIPSLGGVCRDCIDGKVLPLEIGGAPKTRGWEGGVVSIRVTSVFRAVETKSMLSLGDVFRVCIDGKMLPLEAGGAPKRRCWRVG